MGLHRREQHPRTAQPHEIGARVAIAPCPRPDERCSAVFGRLIGDVWSQILIRRLKKDVLTQLPPKIRQRVPLDIPASEKRKLAVRAVARAQGSALTETWCGTNVSSPLPPHQKRCKEMDAKYNMTRAFASNMAQASLDAGQADQQLKMAGDQRQEFMAAFREIGALKAKPAAQYVLNMLEDPSAKLLVFAHHRCAAGRVWDWARVAWLTRRLCAGLLHVLCVCCCARAVLDELETLLTRKNIKLVRAVLLTWRGALQCVPRLRLLPSPPRVV